LQRQRVRAKENADAAYLRASISRPTQPQEIEADRLMENDVEESPVSAAAATATAANSGADEVVYTFY
jgi:hypothetical protein